MKTAFAYARVSTKDQEQKGNSIPEQISRIEYFAKNEKIDIVKIYQDTGSAYHDENRPQFNQMLPDAIEKKVNYILVDESSRFARTQAISVASKSFLRKHSIDVLFANEFNVDSNSIAGVWFDGIRDIKNQAHAMEISLNTKRGMAGNIKQRDPESGWCYKNGGRAPYGYIVKSINLGTDSKGKAIVKSIWDLHSDNSKIVKKIIVELYTDQNFSYDKIRDYLNSKNIPGPSGKPWGTSTISEMLKIERLEQYAGTAIWNKVNRKTKGGKKNHRDEWIIEYNAHIAIITEEELKRAIQRKENGKTDYVFSATKESPYLFSGKNFDKRTLFTCAECGGSIIGYRNSAKHWKKYVCSQNRYKGEAGCTSTVKIDANWLEEKVIEEIGRLYTAPTNIENFIDNIKEEVSTGNKGYHESISDLNRTISKYEKERSNLVIAIKGGLNDKVVTNELNALQANIERAEAELKELKDNPPRSLKESEESMIRSFLSSFSNAFENATISEKKELVRTFVRSMILDPKKQEVRVTYFPDLVHRIGVGRGT
jgi:site-specific DNA recombinase